MRVHVLRHAIVLVAVLGCSNDACFIPPCPLPIAVDLTVSAPNAPSGINGLTVTYSGTVNGSGSCAKGVSSTCWVTGPAGPYQIEVSAPGYVPVKLGVTVTGTQPGGCSCGTVDTQHFSVVMQPAGA